MQKLSKDEMKKVIGGQEQTCNASCTCGGGGSVSCSGAGTCNVTWGNDQHTYCTGVDCGTGGSSSC